MLSAFNVLEAAVLLGIKKVVMASSISALGFAFQHRPFSPLRLPVDETHPLRSQDCYGLSKMLGEELAEGIARREPTLSLTSLRFTWVINEADQKMLRETHDAQSLEDGTNGAFWTYVDVRDAALACRLALEYDAPGHEAIYICAPNIYHPANIEDLLARHFPGDYPVGELVRGQASPVDCSKAARLLGWRARWNWDGQQLAG